MEFHISIIATDHREYGYNDMDGPEETAKAYALSRFKGDHPGIEVEEILALPMTDYINAHQCRDANGRGCCDYCGGVITGSPLWREINGAYE